MTGTCTTAAATAEKVVTINGVATPVADALFAITFNAINTAQNPKLKINGDSRFLYKDGKKLTVDNKAFTNTTYQTVLIKALTLPVAKDEFTKGENVWAVVENNVSLSSGLIQGVLPVGKGGTGTTNLDSITVGAAKKDGAGSVIASTYAKLSGAGFSGSITAPDVSVSGNIITSSLTANSISSFTALDDITLAKKSSIEGTNIKAQLGSYFGIKTSSAFDGIKILGAYYKPMDSVSGNATVSVESNTIQSYGHDVLVQGGQKLILMGGDNAIKAYSPHTYGKPVDHTGQAAYMLNEGTDEGIYLLSDHAIIIRSDMNTLKNFKEYKFSEGTFTAPNISVTSTAYSNNVSVANRLYGNRVDLTGAIYAQRFVMGSYFYTENLGNIDSLRTADGQEAMIYAGNNLFLVAGEGARTAVRNAGNLYAPTLAASVQSIASLSAWHNKAINASMSDEDRVSLFADYLLSKISVDSAGVEHKSYKLAAWKSARLVDNISIKSALHPDFRWNVSAREDINIVADDDVFIYTKANDYPNTKSTGTDDEYVIRTASFSGKNFGTFNGIFKGTLSVDSLATFKAGIHAQNKSTIVGASLTTASLNSPKITGTATVDTATVTTASIGSATVSTKASIKSATLSGASLTTASLNSPNITGTATVSTVSATNATVTELTATNATVTGLTTTNATVKTGASLVSATISSAQIPKVTVSTEASITTANIGTKLNLIGQGSVSGAVTLSGTVNINNKVNLGTSSAPQTLVMYENCLVGNTLANTINGSQTFQGLKILRPNSTAKEGNDVVLNAGQNLILSAGEHPITRYVQGVTASSIPSFMETVAGAGEIIYLASDNQIVFAVNCGGSAIHTAKFKSTGVLVLPAGIEGQILTTTAGTVAGSMWLI